MGNSTVRPTARKIRVRETVSAAARREFAAGASVVAVAEKFGIGYAFAYGIAKRAGYASTAANRRAVRAVSVVGNVAEIRTPAGVVRVDLSTGSVRKSRT